MYKQFVFVKLFFSFVMIYESRFRHSRNQQNDETTFSEKSKLYRRIDNYVRHEIIFDFNIWSNKNQRQYICKKKSMKFFNVVYVFDFMINIVANSIFANKNLHFDTTHDHFHKNDKSIVHVSRINAHYVFENNKFEKMNIFCNHCATKNYFKMTSTFRSC